MRFFDKADKEDTEACIAVLEPEDRRAEFDDVFLAFARAMDMLLPDPRALPYVGDLQWLGRVRMAARARYREEHFDLKHCGEKVRALIAEYIGADEIQRLVEPVSVLSHRFDEAIEHLRQPEAKASEMEHAIRHEIKIRYEDNPAFYQSLTERLEKLIADRKSTRISHAEELKQLASLIHELRSVHALAQELGMTQTSFAIYESILRSQDGASDQLRHAAEPRAVYHADVDEDAKQLALRVEEQIRELAVIDWVVKDDIQREMRRRIKRELRAGSVPRDTIDRLASEILDIARRSLAA
jgi:type I restriction enzyme R subunit